MKKLFVFSLFALTTYQLAAMDESAASAANATAPTAASAKAALFRILFKNESDVAITIGLLPLGKSTPTEYSLNGSRNPGEESVVLTIKDLVKGHYRLTVERPISMLGKLREHRILAKPEDQDDNKNRGYRTTALLL